MTIQKLLHGVDAFSTWIGKAFAWLIVVWLWATVVFANLAEAVAEGRGKAQAESLRRSRQETNARLIGDGPERLVPSADLKVDDRVVCEAGDLIPSDGDVIEGIASVDESAITGESAPVIRESGGDRSAVTGGTRVLSDEIVIRITARPGETFLDRMIALVEGASRFSSPASALIFFYMHGAATRVSSAAMTSPGAVLSVAHCTAGTMRWVFARAMLDHHEPRAPRSSYAA